MSAGEERQARIWIRKRRFWWTAMQPDEPLGEIDTPTYVRSRTRAGVIRKAQRRWGPRPSPWEEITVTGSETPFEIMDLEETP